MDFSSAIRAAARPVHDPFRWETVLISLWNQIAFVETGNHPQEACVFSFRSLREIEAARVTPVLRRVARNALTRFVLSYPDTGYAYAPDVDGYVDLSDAAGDDPKLARLLGMPFPGSFPA